MSSPYRSSPLRHAHHRSLVDAGRWTIDNSEDRISKLSIQSPRRSILKGSHTPSTFHRPHYFQSQIQRQELLRLARRRVSFAPDPSVRTFDENEASSSVQRDADVQSSATVPMDEIEKPSHTSELEASSSQFTLLTGSPIHRKRQNNYLGSPLAPETSQERHFRYKVLRSMPNHRMREDRGEDEGEEGTLLPFLAASHQKGKRNLFEDDDQEQTPHIPESLMEFSIKMPIDLESQQDLSENTQQHTLEAMSTTSQNEEVDQTPKILNPPGIIEWSAMNEDSIQYLISSLSQESPPSRLNASVIDIDEDTINLRLNKDLPYFDPTFDNKKASDIEDQSRKNEVSLEASPLQETAVFNAGLEKSSIEQTLEKQKDQPISLWDILDHDFAEEGDLAQITPFFPKTYVQEQVLQTNTQPSTQDIFDVDGSTAQSAIDYVRNLLGGDQDINQPVHAPFQTSDSVLQQPMKDNESINNSSSAISYTMHAQEEEMGMDLTRNTIQMSDVESDQDMDLTQNTIQRPNVSYDQEDEADMDLTQNIIQKSSTENTWQNEADIDAIQQTHKELQYNMREGLVDMDLNQHRRSSISMAQGNQYENKPTLYDRVDDVFEIDLESNNQLYEPAWSNSQEGHSFETRLARQTSSPRFSASQEIIQSSQQIPARSLLKRSHTMDVFPKSEHHHRRNSLHTSLNFTKTSAQSTDANQTMHSPLRQYRQSSVDAGYSTPLLNSGLGRQRTSINYLSPFTPNRSRTYTAFERSERGGTSSSLHTSQPNIAPEYTLSPHRPVAHGTPFGTPSRVIAGFIPARTLENQRLVTPLRDNQWTNNTILQSVLDNPTNSVFANHDDMEEIFNNDIPELSESPVGEEPVPTLPVNFPGFLDYVGLYFNNEVPVNVKSPLTSFDLEQVTPATLIEKAFAAVSTLPQLTVYNKIYDDMKAIETESSEKMKIHYENDPQCQQLIREYFEGDTDLRCNMIKRLKQLKQYCDIKARYIVQEQHNKRLRELHKKLRENLDRAERDTGYVDEANRYIDTHMPMFDDYRLKLANAVKECRKREDEYNSVNHEAQALLEDEIESQRSAMNLFRKEYNDLTSAEFESREKIEQIKQKKAEVMESISRAIICRDENKGPTKKDVEDAEDRLKRLSSLMCIKFNQRSNKITDITMSDDIHVVIDMIKLKNRESEAVTVQLIEERKSTYEEFSELLCGIDSVIENEYDDIKIMRNIWFYWHRIRAVRYEIFLTRWRFFTKLTRLTDVSSEPLRNTKERGVVVETTAFSYMANAKFLLLLQFQPRDMYLYPLLDMSKVEIVVKFGDIPVNEIRTLLAQKGIINLRETLTASLSGKINDK